MNIGPARSVAERSIPAEPLRGFRDPHRRSGALDPHRSARPVKPLTRRADDGGAPIRREVPRGRGNTRRGVGLEGCKKPHRGPQADRAAGRRRSARSGRKRIETRCRCAMVTNEIERGNAVVIASDSFTIDDVGARAQRLDDQRKAAREVIAGTAIERSMALSRRSDQLS